MHRYIPSTFERKKMKKNHHFLEEKPS